MPKIHFTSAPKIPSDMADEWKDYVFDSVHEVNNDEAERWLARGVAEIVTPSVSRRINVEKEEVKVEEKEPVKTEEPNPIAPAPTASTPPVQPDRSIPRR